ncbi:MAG TPA: LysE family translocator [Solirubrobacterales bacterium]|nr:LysE family translocator [Solirubrobacterales bacterium]
MAELLTFAAVAVVVILVPGPDMALVTRNTVSAGRRAGFATSAGVCTGILVHGCAAALGLSAIVRASSTAFSALKLAGAAYLIYLGAQALWRSWQGGAADGPPATSRAGGSPFRQGLLSNVLNPKLAVFFLTVLPQFIDPGSAAAPRSLLLAGIYAAMCAVWLFGFTMAMSRVREAMRSERVTRLVERVTGTVLVAVGFRLALARR